jgi:hypothetical protein
LEADRTAGKEQRMGFMDITKTPAEQARAGHDPLAS